MNAIGIINGLLPCHITPGKISILCPHQACKVVCNTIGLFSCAHCKPRTGPGYSCPYIRVLSCPWAGNYISCAIRTGGLPCLPWFSRPRLSGAYGPNVVVLVGLIVGVHVATPHTDEPRAGAGQGVGSRRPVQVRLHIAETLRVQPGGRIRLFCIYQALKLVYVGKMPICVAK